MPCTGGGPSESQVREPRRVKAALCAALTYLSEHQLLTDFYEEFDQERAGIDREWLKKWWEDHQAEDRAREFEEEKTVRILQRERKRLEIKIRRFEEETGKKV